MPRARLHPARLAPGQAPPGRAEPVEAGWTTGLTGPRRTSPVWDGEPGFEFDSRPRTSGPDPFSPGLFSADDFNASSQLPHGGAHAEWSGLIGSLRPGPARRSRLAEFRAALRFRGAGLRVIVPILTMIVVGVVVAVIAGANNSHQGQAPPPAALGFPPATLAGGDFTAAGNGRGITEVLSGVASDGAEIVAVGSQQGARIARAQFFVSTDAGRSWAMGAVRTPGGGPPPPGSAARFVAAGPDGWIAIGPGSIWTSPNGQTWTLASTAGLPLRPGDQISVLQRTAAGFIAAGSNVPGGNQAQATPVIFLSADGLSWRRLGAGQLGLGQLAPGQGAASLGRVLSIRYAAADQNQILIAGDVAVPPRGGTRAAGQRARRSPAPPG